MLFKIFKKGGAEWFPRGLLAFPVDVDSVYLIGFGVAYVYQLHDFLFACGGFACPFIGSL